MADHDERDLPRHPIGVVAERTGLTPDVLRVWERRYGAVRPQRARGGQRLYSTADVERLRLLGQATAAGRSIGQLASLSVAELARLVREDEAARALAPAHQRATTSFAPGYVAEQGVALARAFDAPALERLLTRAASVLGVPAFLEAVCAPLLRRVGDEWHAGRLTPSQEHLATAVVQRVIATTMTALPAPGEAPTLVVATPAGERHEIGAVLAAAAAAAEGWRVIYLGADLPAGEIASAALGARADAVGVSIVLPSPRERVLAELASLRSLLPAGVLLLAGGAGAVSLAPELTVLGARVVTDLQALRVALRDVGAPEAV